MLSGLIKEFEKVRTYAAGSPWQSSFAVKTVRVLCCILLLSSGAFPQFSSPNFRSQHFTVAEGLSSGLVYKFHQDKYGYVWIATANGLNRFDGYTFQVFLNNKATGQSLPDNRVFDIQDDGSGNLWTSFLGGRISHFNISTGDFQNLTPEKMFIPGDVQTSPNLSVCKDKILNYTCRGSRYFYRYYPLNGQFASFPLSQTNEYEYILHSGKLDDTTVLISTNQKTLRFFSVTTGKFTDEIVNLPFSAIVFNVVGDYVFFSEISEKAGCYNLRTKKLIPLDADFIKRNKEFMCFVRDAETDTYYAVSATGSFVIMKEPFTKENLIAENKELTQSSDLSTIMILNDHTILIGSRGWGIFVLKKNEIPFTSITSEKKDLSVQSVRSVYAINNSLFVAGYYGLDIYNLKTKDYISHLRDVTIYSALPDPDNPDDYVWIGGESYGLMFGRYSLKNKVAEWFDIGLDPRSIHTVYKIVQDKKKNFWIGADNKLVYFNRRGLTGQVYTLQNGNTAIQVRDIQEMDKNLLAVSCGTGGLQFFDKELKVFVSAESILGTNLNGAVCLSTYYSNDFLWIATNGSGLYRVNLKTKELLHLTVKDGLPNDIVYGILPDRKGNVWLSTNKGIVRFSRENGSMLHFSVKEGLQDNEFNSQAFFSSAAGILYFGGIKGVSWVNPETIRESTHFMPVYLSSVKYMNTGKALLLPHELNRELSFNHSELPVVLQFSALSFANANEVVYYFKMNDTLGSWKYLGKSREIMLANLEGGTYTLNIKATDNAGSLYSSVLTLTITIVPPFYKTWWFVLCSIAGLGVIIALLFWHRLYTINTLNRGLEQMVSLRTGDLERSKAEILSQKKNLEALNYELTDLNKTKDTFFSIIAHDLRSPFSTLLGSLRLLNEDYDIMPEEERRQFLRGSETLATSTFDLLENLLQWSQVQRGKLPFNKESFSPNIIIRKIITLNGSQLKKKEITIHNNVPGDLLLDTDENIFFFVMRNIVNNAVKFTPRNGSVTIATEMYPETIHFSVTDTGIGMSKETIAVLTETDNYYTTQGTAQERGTGLGIRLCISLMKIAGGSIVIVSSEGRGSIITAVFPR